MTRTASQRISDILDAIAICERFRPYLFSEEEDLPRMAFDAALRNIAVIGEAVNHLPASITTAWPEIDWAAIVGIRHILVHQYYEIDPHIIIDVLDHDLTPLAQVLNNYDR